MQHFAAAAAGSKYVTPPKDTSRVGASLRFTFCCSAVVRAVYFCRPTGFWDPPGTPERPVWQAPQRSAWPAWCSPIDRQRHVTKPVDAGQSPADRPTVLPGHPGPHLVLQDGLQSPELEGQRVSLWRRCQLWSQIQDQPALQVKSSEIQHQQRVEGHDGF